MDDWLLYRHNKDEEDECDETLSTKDDKMSGMKYWLTNYEWDQCEYRLVKKGQHG